MLSATGTTMSAAVRAVVRIIFLGTISLLLASYSVYGQAKMGAAERLLFDDVNRERTTQGLPNLTWDTALAAAAHQHAVLMAQRNSLSHQLSGEPLLQDRAIQLGARFSLIAENIGKGSSAAMIHDAWMQSTHHRANILDLQLTAVGIAVVQEGRELFAVQDFSQLVPNLSLGEQEKKVISLLAARDLRAAKATAEARKTCDMNRGFAGDRPSSVVRFETANLSKLPDDLEKKIHSKRYSAAAVGACTMGETKGFTRYRIAVVLF
ncbi:MAG TPA: CAP domain-containing protein [Candidatus Dormibacteraeota bacterium]|nr:CAP domain-containing protein [Candidatus Dormibacteraeota bacterium]